MGSDRVCDLDEACSNQQTCAVGSLNMLERAVAYRDGSSSSGFECVLVK